MTVTTVEPVIERIEIIPAIDGLRTDSCIMASRGVVENGRFRYIDPVNLLVGDIDAAGLPQQVQDAIASINRSQIQSLTKQIKTLTEERDARPTQQQLDAANEQITTLQNRIAELTAEPQVPIVSRRQARLALLQMGLFDQIEQVVYAAETPKGIRIEYEGDTWRRDNPTLIAMTEQLGMTTETLDQFFQLAGTL